MAKQNLSIGLKSQLEQLTKELESLKKENHNLKNGFQLDFEEAKRIYKEKSALLKDFDFFKLKHSQLSEIKIIENNDLTDNEHPPKFNFTVRQEGRYNDESIISISNPLIVTEIRDYVLKLIDSKLKDIESKLVVLV